jgi:hypothetical protein
MATTPYPTERLKIMAKAKAPKAKVTITIPAINTAWTSLVAKTQKIDGDATSAIITFAKVIASRKVDIRNARKSIEELGTKSPILLTSQIEALPTLIELLALGKGFDTFKNMDIKTKLTKATAAYKLGVGIAVAMPTWEAVQKEITAFNARKNAGKSATPKEDKETKPSKAKATVADTLRSAISLVEGIEDGCEEEVYDLLLELAQAVSLKVGIDA